MLTTKRINLGIFVLSRIARFVIIFYTAVILAKTIWWILSPADSRIFIQWADLDVHDKATAYIANRNPFGIIVVTKPKEKEKPRVVDQLKLTGVYLNTNKDSFAFLEYQGKPMVIRMGGKISDSGAVVKSIGPESIVVNADDQEATVHVTSGSASQGGSTAGGSNNAPATMFGNRNGNLPANNMNNNSNPNQAAEEFRDQRRRMMEEYNSRNNQGKQAGSSDDDDNNNNN